MVDEKSPPPAPDAGAPKPAAQGPAPTPATPAGGAPATPAGPAPAIPAGAAPPPKPAAPATPAAAAPPPKPAAPAAAAAPTAPAAAPAKVATAALKPQPPKSVSKPEAPKSSAEDAALRRRRDFVWYGVAGLITVSLITFARIFFPRTLFEPKTKFTIGYAADFGFGVDTKFQQAQRIWVCRSSRGIYVILAICTHLGCTPDWLATENQFKCPCHGSVYDSEGRNFAGPAPMPMRRCHVALNSEGKIVVDKLKTYEARDFDKPGAFLAV